MTKLVWCEKATKLASDLHLANVAICHETANSKDSLEAIGKAVVAHVNHKGIVPTANSVRSKLAVTLVEGVKVYNAVSGKAAKPAGGIVTITKATMVSDLHKTLGGGAVTLGTLANGNVKELEFVSSRVALLVEGQLSNASIEEMQARIGELQDAEVDAIVSGADIESIAAVEAETVALMSQESADNLEENS
jgi:hypothetical protein